MLIVAALLTIPDVSRLGSHDWASREATESHLRLMWFLAVPWLMEAAGSDSPEVRCRAYRLLAPWRFVQADLEALALLTSPWEHQRPWDLYRDYRLRKRLARIAEVRGVERYNLRMLDPDTETDRGIWCFEPNWLWPAAELENARMKIGGYKPWLLR